MREMIPDNRGEMEIDLQKLLIAYLSKWWLIGICTIGAALLSIFITANFITPMYKASVTVYVNSVRSGERLDSISSSNLATAQRLVNTYVNIIKSDSVLEKVAETSHLDITAKDIRNAMSAAQVEDTELFKVHITHPDPEMAAQIANAVAEVAPGMIEEYVEGSSTKIIDYAKVPTGRSSPSFTKNTILGAMIGGLLAVLYVTLRFLMDVRIKDESDLMALFELPVLARIPSFADTEKSTGGYGKTSYGYESSAARGGEKE